jgi:hypothetical protein
MLDDDTGIQQQVTRRIHQFVRNLRSLAATRRLPLP